MRTVTGKLTAWLPSYGDPADLAGAAQHLRAMRESWKQLGKS